jgi:hypothetical protein
MALRNCRGGLADLYAKEGRYSESARQWEQILAISDPDKKEDTQFFVAMALARAGEHRKAWGLVQTLRPSLVKRPAAYHFHLVVVTSLCIAAAEQGPALSAEDRARACSDFGVAGVDLLRHALQLVPEPERAARRSALLIDADMAPLCRRADVKALLADTGPARKPTRGDASVPGGNK